MAVGQRWAADKKCCLGRLSVGRQGQERLCGFPDIRTGVGEKRWKEDQSPGSTAGFEESCGAQGQRPHVAGAGAHCFPAVPRGP